MKTEAEVEQKVLSAIQGAPCEFFFPFASIMQASGLTRSEVRTACRSLRAQGLAEFSNGLVAEDGDMVGSGYAITPAGQVVIDANERAKP
ncbi:MAG: hypothetical protein IIB58_13540 [Planctomycetes bacterium]|nr:hypothetical protein [Planctomycetota bacterium]